MTRPQKLLFKIWKPLFTDPNCFKTNFFQKIEVSLRTINMRVESPSTSSVQFDAEYRNIAFGFGNWACSWNISSETHTHCNLTYHAARHRRKLRKVKITKIVCKRRSRSWTQLLEEIRHIIKVLRENSVFSDARVYITTFQHSILFHRPPFQAHSLSTLLQQFLKLRIMLSCGNL